MIWIFQIFPDFCEFFEDGLRFSSSNFKYTIIAVILFIKQESFVLKSL